MINRNTTIDFRKVLALPDHPFSYDYTLNSDGRTCYCGADINRDIEIDTIANHANFRILKNKNVSENEVAERIIIDWVKNNTSVIV